MEQTQDAWRMLLNSLEQKDEQIWDMRKREIEILQKLMDKEEHIKGLFQAIAELTFEKEQRV